MEVDPKLLEVVNRSFSQLDLRELVIQNLKEGSKDQVMTSGPAYVPGRNKRMQVPLVIENKGIPELA